MDAQGFSLPDWQRVHGIPLASGQLRTELQDFNVVEILGFEASGEGEHDFLYIEKTGANTAWIARGLAKFAGVPVRDVGFAGMKDRRAVTRQWFSVRRPAGVKADWEQFDRPGVSVLDIRRHHRKLRRGTHQGNRFQVTIRALSDNNAEIIDRLQSIAETGVPNYFGEQRFGRNGNNVALAHDLFGRRRRMPREKRSMALSTARSLIFNDILSSRVEAGNWNTLIEGDTANLDGSGSVFSIEGIDMELQERCRMFDIHPTGALWGKESPTTRAAARELEERAAEGWPKLAAGLVRTVDEARRSLRLIVKNLEWSKESDCIELKFSLSRGGFATAVLRECVAYAVASNT